MQSVRGRKKKRSEDHEGVHDERKDLIQACITITRNLPYTIEEVLDHTVDWVNEVLEEIRRQQLEEQLLQMAMHGISEDVRNSYRRKSEIDLSKHKKIEDVHVPLANFTNAGLSIGKTNKTKVKR